MTSHHLLWTAGGMAVIWVMAGTKDAGMSGAGATPLIGTVDVTPPDPTPTQKKNPFKHCHHQLTSKTSPMPTVCSASLSEDF